MLICSIVIVLCLFGLSLVAGFVGMVIFEAVWDSIREWMDKKHRFAR